MSFSKLLDKTKSGEILTESEIKELAITLGLETSKPLLIFKLIIIAGMVAGSLYLYSKNNIAGIVVGSICFILAILLLIRKKKINKIVDYLDAIQTYYLSRFSDYEGYETLFLIHNYQRNGFLQNNLCLLLSNGKEILIFDDMLKETKYYLPKVFKSKLNPEASLKVLDSDFAHKRSIYFPVSEIDNFYATCPYKGEPNLESNLANDYYRYTFVPKNPVLKDFCFVELTDRTIFKFSPEAVDLFRRVAKDKEVK